MNNTPNFWPDGTPRSRGNAFDAAGFRSGLDLQAFRAKSKAPETPGGFAKHHGTIAGGLGRREAVTAMKASGVALPGSLSMPLKKAGT